jgi:aarF domain-containing kinase
MLLSLAASGLAGWQLSNAGSHLRAPTAPLSRSVIRLAETASSSSPSIKFPSPIETFQRLNSAEARKLQKELLELAFEQDPQVVIRRSLDLTRALQTVGTEAITGLTTSSTPPEAPVVLRRMCEELGATYVKLGQFIASSPTLFPPEYVQEFQKCLDSTPPMPWSDVKTIVEAELGKPIGAVYASVEQTPLAAASIAQVHAAKLLSGEDVVIKVQKKGVQGSLKADLDLLYANARVLQLLGVVTAELSDVVSTLRSAILEEIDFVLEAQRTEQFAEFLARSPELAGVVTVPKVYRSASATRILTLERLYGVPLVDLDSVREYQPNPELALIVALNTWVSSVLTNEWFHADVHAGNLLVLTDGRVAFIDFGIVGSIPRSTADGMLDFVRAFPAGDMLGVGKALEKMGFTKELSEEQSASFARDIGEVFESVDSMAADIVTTANAGAAASAVDETQLNRAVAAVARVAEGYGIRFPREFALLIKQVLYFDRYTSLLAPDLDVLNDERLSMNRPSGAAAGADAVLADAEGSVVPSVEVEVEVLPPQ